jgi:Tetratricopeptide repeat
MSVMSQAPGRLCITASLLVALTSAPAAAAAPTCARSCTTVACAREAARCLLEGGDPRAAKSLLKEAVFRHPKIAELRLLLAQAYLALDNRVWARRVLVEAVGTLGGSCQLRSWLIWVQLQNAELDEAAALLDEPGCPGKAPMKGRWHLLRGTLARHRLKPEKAAGQLDKADDMGTLYQEDRQLHRQLVRYARPGLPPPVDLRLELGGGYTSDGLAGSPSDTAHPEGRPSPLVSVDLLALFEPPWGRLVRPALELGLRGLFFTDEEVQDFGHLALSVRPGLRLGDLRLGYGGQLFLLTGGDTYDTGPRAYYETHRGEVEWAPRPWVTLLAGAGRSIFREAPRSRTELDGSVGLSFRPWRLAVLAILSLRGHWAQHDAYNLGGGTLITSATLPLGPVSLRARFLLSVDLYPDSAGYFDAAAATAPAAAAESRRDLLLKGGLEGWSPAWRGMRAGLSYELSGRESSIDAYNYTDHRVLLRLRLRLDFDPWAPSTADDRPGHVRLPVGAASAKDRLEDERIQDLLRQEDAARRGSTCVN